MKPNVVTSIAREYGQQHQKIAEFDQLKKELEAVRVQRPTVDNKDTESNNKNNVSLKKVLEERSSQNRMGGITPGQDLEVSIG